MSGSAFKPTDNATPLLSIDAVVLDTETTGLDPREARVIQIGAVGLLGGLQSAGDVYDALVNPGGPIPPVSTGIHGISDADVADALPFAGIAEGLDAYIGGRIVVGHNIGFDLAVLKREHERAGMRWDMPRTLDTRLLSTLVAPKLPGHSIEQLSEWLGIEITDRHTALGDARVTAAILIALVPKLRERNIRTLAEAEAACARLTDMFEDQYRAGWVEPVRREAAALSERALSRIDAYPYRHKIGDVMSTPPIVVPASASLRDALKVLADRRVSSLFVGNVDELKAAECGILTERDVLRAVAEKGGDALADQVADHATRRLECVFEDAYLYRAIGRMARLKVRHLGVMDETGLIVGALSQRDLLRMRATDAVSLGDEIDSARTVNALAVAWAKLPAVARGLVAEGIDGRDVAGVISRELCALTRRAGMLAEEQMVAEGIGGPPVDYALLVLGSGGRGESLLAADQDNAIVYADPPSGEEVAVDSWFAEYGRRVADTLHAAGVPYCTGGVMAVNAEWRASISTWRERVADWVRRSRPQDLLNVDIFFDLRAVHGNAALAREIWTFAYEQGGGAVEFAKLMAESAAGFSAPLTFFGGLKAENGRIDLKKGGLFPIVANARVLSIRHHVLERATRARLDGVRALEIGAGEDLEQLVGVHALLVDLVLEQQLTDVARGLPPSNKIETGRLNRSRADDLKRALSALDTLDQTVRDLLFS
jgi:DNA polymerase-3 subunit epsilon/CBS domain-containing protein